MKKPSFAPSWQDSMTVVIKPAVQLGDNQEGGGVPSPADKQKDHPRVPHGKSSRGHFCWCG